jgi:hypothetical protein
MDSVPDTAGLLTEILETLRRISGQLAPLHDLQDEVQTISSILVDVTETDLSPEVNGRMAEDESSNVLRVIVNNSRLEHVP